jgi:hypothetical protein
MQQSVTRPRRALAGLILMGFGAGGLVTALAAPATAHESKDEPDKLPDGLSCIELAELYDIDQDWEQLVIDDLPDQDEFTNTYVLSDRGTPEDESDDATVTIKVKKRKTFEWSATVGIDAVYVQGSDTGMEENSYFYLYDQEEMSDIDLGTPPYRDYRKNKIKSITFCWDDDHRPPDSTTTSTTATTDTTTTTMVEETTTTVEETTTTMVDETTTTEAATTPTTAPPTTSDSGGGLPVTGSNTGMLVAIGAGLLAAGAALVASTRSIWRRRIRPSGS